MAGVIPVTRLAAGNVSGRLLVSPEALSFWGGYDPASGEIIDRRHPLSGHSAAGRLLALPETRGSSTTTAILLEAIRTGNAPAALIITETDPFLVLASVVGEVQYGVTMPVVRIAPSDFNTLVDGGQAVLEDGALRTG